MLRRAELALALLVGLAAAPGTAAAHEALSLEDEFVKGVFSPNFVPPVPGSYELPAVKRVAGFVLRDSTGRAVNTHQIAAGKVAVVSFIYTACPERLGCPLASLALQDLQGRLKDEGLCRDVVLISISFDPGRDGPAQLAKYARVYGADPAFWRFMTAPSTRVLEEMLDKLRAGSRARVRLARHASRAATVTSSRSSSWIGRAISGTSTARGFWCRTSSSTTSRPS